MERLDTIRRLWAHARWADSALLEAIQHGGEREGDALRELAHIAGAEEVWLSRLEQRPPRSAVWPEGSARGVREIMAAAHDGYERYLSSLTEADLDRGVSYVNSAGQAFTNSVGDILLHVALHGQYHRGKANLLLRQGSGSPEPVDFIAFVRGVPAATEATARDAAGQGGVS